jgi:hypothetical protein
MTKIISLILIGMLLGILNSIALNWTLKKFVRTKQISVIVISHVIRIFFITFIFYIFLDGNWKNPLFMLFGLTISKLFFIILTKLKINKNGNKS